MANPEALLPAAPERPLLDEPDEEKLRREIETLRRELEEERKRNKDKGSPGKEPSGRPRKKTLWLIALALLAVLVIAFLAGFLPHRRREQQLRKDAEAEAKELPILTYIYAARSPSQTELILPGSIEALTEAPVLARADGYLKKRYVDIGDRVQEGQLLADIAAPDLDQQVTQARAQLLQAHAALRQSTASLDQGRANQALAKVTADRWAALLKRGAVSPQDNDTRQASYQAQTANVLALGEAVSAAQQNISAAEANLNRLIELQSYEQVRAPFSGVITLRNVDTGALITNGQTLLFRLAQTDVLRTYIDVPESNAPLVQVGQKAILRVEEYPGGQFTGEITRTSDALDPTTRTLLTEVRVPNANHSLAPGMFSEVSLRQSRPHPPVLIPADSLIVRANGTFVAVLQGNAPNEDRNENASSAGDQNPGKPDSHGSENKKTTNKGTGNKEKNDKQDKAALLKQQQQLPTFTVHLTPVTIGRDYGNAIEILTGLRGGERIVESPNDQVEENARVKGQKAKENPATATGGQPNKSNANSEQLNPDQPGTEPAPKNPSKENMNRGPG